MMAGDGAQPSGRQLSDTARPVGRVLSLSSGVVPCGILRQRMSRTAQVLPRVCSTALWDEVPRVNVVVCRDPMWNEWGDCVKVALLIFTSIVHDFHFGKSDGLWPGSSLVCFSLTWENLLLHVALYLLKWQNAGCSPCKWTKLTSVFKLTSSS